MKKLKQGDPVKVIAGKFKGKTSKIVSVDGDLVVVDGINVMKKAVKWKGFVDKIKHQTPFKNFSQISRTHRRPQKRGDIKCFLKKLFIS